MTGPHAIPTLYAGARFRSRLEARWAAMFDLLGWEWAYEPVDLPGYIPDFRVRGLLIECRPAIDESWSERAEEQLRAARVHGLVLTSELLVCAVGRLHAGVIAFVAETEPAHFVACGSCGGASLAFELASDDCHDYLDEDYDGPHDVAGLPCCAFCRSLDCRELAPGAPGIVQLWRQAGNEVQWAAHGIPGAWRSRARRPRNT